MPGSTQAEIEHAIRKRVIKLALVVAVGMILLIARAFQLQVLEHRNIAQQSIDRSVRRVPVTPVRGQVMDRSGVVLAKDREAFDVLVIPSAFLGKASERLPALAAALDLGPLEQTRLRDTLARQTGARSTELFRIRRGLTSNEVKRLRTDSHLRYVVVVQPRAAREYPMGSLAFHAVGHLGELGPERAADATNDGSPPGTMTGRSGAEGSFDDDLRGVEGIAWEPVTRRVRGVEANKRARDSIAGHDVVLTIDSRMQRALYDAFDQRGQRLGAAVVLEVASGRVLALVSRPSLDPMLFTRTLAPELWARILGDPDRPMLNRAVSAAQAPGSTFKPFVALAAWASGTTQDREWVCRGELELERMRFRCTGEHGSVTIGSALKERCHIPFFAFAADRGPDPIARAAAAFGFGEPTGVELRDEIAGKMLERGSLDSERAAALSAAIGQGALAVTPIQLAVAYAAIANGGTVLRPHLLERVVGPGGTVVRSPRMHDRRNANAPPMRLKLVRDALNRGFIGAQGWAARPPPEGGVSVALTRSEGQEDGAGSRPNTWAAGFAPADNPLLAFVVLAERAHDTGVAEAIASDLLTGTLVPRWCDASSEAETPSPCVRGARP